jgi:single-strand DNA-binding protein
LELFLKKSFMNATLNKVMLIGHLGEDVKLHYFKSDSCIGRFSLATNDVYINKETGEKITSTEWHTIVVRNKEAELCEKYLSKGDKIYVEGRLKSRQWQADDGTSKYTTEIQAIDFTFLTTKRGIEATPANIPEDVSKKVNFEAKKDGLPINDLPF